MFLRILGVVATATFLLLNIQNAEAQVGRDLTVKINQAGAGSAVATRTNVAFVITASNIRSGAASNVKVTVTMPTAFTSLSATPEPASGFTCTFSGNICNCTTASLGGLTQKTFRISSTAPSSIAGTQQSFEIVAQIDPQDTVSETDNGNNSDRFTINVVTRADLDVNASGPAGLGTNQVAPDLIYNVTARNTGDRDAPNLLVRSTLPKDTSFVRVESNTLGTCLQNSTDSAGALQVNCTLSSLPAGANRSVRIVGRLIGTTPNGTQVTFASNIDPNNSVAERNDTNNTSFIISTVKTPVDLQVTGSITQTGSSIGLVGEREFREYTAKLTVKNNGPNRSTATTLRVQWPTNFTVSNDSSVCFRDCSVGAIDPGQSIQIRVKGVLLGPFQGGKSTTVQIACTVDPNQTLLDAVLSNNTLSSSLSVPIPVTFAN